MYQGRQAQALEGAPVPASRTRPAERGGSWLRRGLWVIGLFVLVIASVIVHGHPGPWPVDLQTTITVQHMPIWGWLEATLNFISIQNDPIPSVIEAAVWLVIFFLMRRFVEGLFIGLGTAAADGIDGLLSTIVGRPRPSSPQIQVRIPEPFHSFPSGHTEHDMVYYGFLLYLSFLKPVREWRYRWFLLPLQIYAVVALVSIGYSRVLEGSHWVTDVLGGYLSGAILLGVFIFLYRWVKEKVAQRRARLGKA